MMLTGLLSHGQNVNDFLFKLNQNYTSDQFQQIDMIYSLFNGTSHSEIIETYTANYIYNHSFSYRKMNDIEIICQDSTMLTIDHEFKEIDISYNHSVGLLEFDVKDMLKYCEKVNLIPLSEKNGYLLDLRIKDNNTIPFSSINIKVDQHFFIKEIKYHYVNQVNFGTFYKPNYGLPVLEVEFKEIKKIKDPSELPKLTEFIQQRNSIIEVTKKFSNYSLEDFRPKSRL